MSKWLLIGALLGSWFARDAVADEYDPLKVESIQSVRSIDLSVIDVARDREIPIRVYCRRRRRAGRGSPHRPWCCSATGWAGRGRGRRFSGSTGRREVTWPCFCSIGGATNRSGRISRWRNAWRPFAKRRRERTTCCGLRTCPPCSINSRSGTASPDTNWRDGSTREPSACRGIRSADTRRRPSPARSSRSADEHSRMPV